MKTIALKKPVEHGGVTIAEIVLDMEKLTGADGLKCEREAVSENGGQIVGAQELAQVYLMHIASAASGLSVEVFKKLRLDDFNTVTRAVQGFFMGAGD